VRAKLILTASHFWLVSCHHPTLADLYASFGVQFSHIKTKDLLFTFSFIFILGTRKFSFVMALNIRHTSNVPKTLVTGGSGFVASHLILQLLRTGNTVRATIRSSTRERKLRQIIQDSGIDAANLSFYVTDLTKDEGWADAMDGCTFVQHVASPFLSTIPKDENEIVNSAREGTIRVLRFARNAGVKRVVLTSSFAAIGYGHELMPLFTENHWSIVEGNIPVPAYHKSKTLAEKSAWDFVRQEGEKLEISVINPTGVFGPVLSSDISSSIQIIKNMINGNMPGCPKISFGVVDERDLADLHIRAMTHPAAAGQRFIATSDNGPIAMIDIVKILRNRPNHTDRLPTKELPNLLVRIAAIFRPSLRGILPELGIVKKIDNKKAKKVLGWESRSIEQCILDTADSLVEHGVV
jgi:nucleoside-diphosphate-sugar epimerase